jgi:hypothetical protein
VWRISAQSGYSDVLRTRLDPAAIEVTRFINAHRDRFEVESICHTLLAVQVCGLEPQCTLIQMKKIRISRKDAGHRHRQAPEGDASQIASQQGMCSLDGRCLFERAPPAR